MMKGYTTSKRGPMNNTPFGDMRKISLTNPLHISDNAWSTDRITLSSEEYLYYVNLFNLNDKFDSHFIDNKTASSFLQNSGLSISVLHSIWEYSDVENKGYLTLEDFFICCRLVAHAQNGNVLNSDIINIQPPCLPSFDIIRHKSFSDISNMEGNVEWKISAREREDYRRIFKTLDMNNEEKIEGSVIREYYLNTSNLSICELMQIWSVSDMDNDGFLNFEQFCVMNKMVEVRKEKEINIPLSIPADLLNSIKDDQKMVMDDDVTFRKVEDKETRDSLKLSFGDLLKTENEKKERGVLGKGTSPKGGSPEDNEKLNMEFDFFEFKQEEKSDMDSSEKEKSKRKKKKEKDMFSERSEKNSLFKNDLDSYRRLEKEDDDDDDGSDDDGEEDVERRNSVVKKKASMKESPSYEDLSTEEISTEGFSKKGKERIKEGGEEEAEGGSKKRSNRKKKERGHRDRGHLDRDRLSKAKEKQKDRQRKAHEKGSGQKNLQLEKITSEEVASRSGDMGGGLEKGRNMNRGNRDMNSGNGKENGKENEKGEEEERKKKTSQSEKYFTKLIDFNYSDLKNYNIEINCLAYVYENELKKYQCLKEERRNLEFINLCLYKDIKHKKENIRSIKNEIKELIEDINKISIENVNINKDYIKKEKEIKLTDNKRKNLNALIDKEKNDLKKDERNLIILKNMIDYLKKQKSRALKLQENLKNRYDVTNSDHQMLIKNILHQQNYLNKITQKRLNTQKVKNQNLLYFNSLCNQSALVDMQNNTHTPDAKSLGAHRRYFTDRKGIPNEQSDELKSSKRNVELFEQIKNGDSVDIFSSMDDESVSHSQEYVEGDDDDSNDDNNNDDNNDDDSDDDDDDSDDEKRQKRKNNMEDLANLVSKDHSLKSIDDSS
ncbi:putative Formin 2 [Plasmodium knowlesi]|uniref:Putative Formin 2 n=1 Tax=Plasmodium knowlesi TaxID=5850 RepID=A0A1Y3DU83_PLAKN|nr:putative Formin 2 [Plasmodium knowlesi]